MRYHPLPTPGQSDTGHRNLLHTPPRCVYIAEELATHTHTHKQEHLIIFKITKKRLTLHMSGVFDVLVSLYQNYKAIDRGIRQMEREKESVSDY